MMLSSGSQVEIRAWLSSLGFADQAVLFERHAIDVPTLCRLTADDLAALGVERVGDRRRLLDAIALLRAERHAERRPGLPLGDEWRRLSLILENVSEAITAIFLDTGTTLRNRAWLHFHGYASWEELPVWRLEDMMQLVEVFDTGGRRLSLADVPMSRAMAGDPFTDLEVRLRRTDTGREWWGSYNGSALRDGDGRVVAAIISMRDVTDRKLAAERQQLLVEELSHRVKNLLTLVSAIARQTRAGARTAEEFERRFDGRLQALAAAQDVLTRGHEQGVSLAELVRVTLIAPMGERAALFELDLEPLALAAPAAQSLALAFHELATNAQKYGALSGEAGRVRLVGRRLAAMPPALELRWEERGGPRVRPPRRTGFGTTLLTRVLQLQHKGVVDLDWRPAGLSCRIVLPLAELTPPA